MSLIRNVCGVLASFLVYWHILNNFSRNELLVMLINVCSEQTSIINIVLFTGTDDYEIYLSK